MKHFVSAGLAAGLTMFAVMTPAAAQAPLMDKYDPGTVRGAIDALGWTVLDETTAEAETPMIDFKTGEGVTGRVAGVACGGEGDAHACRGLRLLSFSEISDLAVAETFVIDINRKYAALKAHTSADDGLLILSDYIILDHGLAPENFQVVLGVFGQIAGEAWKLYPTT